MNPSDLDERAKQLKQREVEDEGIIRGIRLDILKSMANDIDDNAQLQKIFGPNVSKNLAVMPIINDLQIVDAGKVDLTPEQRTTFINQMKDIRKKYLNNG